MDRTIVFPSAIPVDLDVLQPQQNTMIALGYILQAAYDNNTVFVGLDCLPTAPASMQINIAPGAVVAPEVLESTPFGSIAADTADPLVKIGINIGPSPFTLSAPTVSGQSQNYLIQGAFSEADDTAETVIYFNAANPNQPFSGPQGTATPQNTRRAQRVNLEIKPGVAANTGNQITPPVDDGWFGLYIITVSYGQTAITTSNIVAFPGAPFLTPFLSSHHSGAPGAAPKINLASEVQGILSLSNLPSAVGSSVVYAGDPNGHVQGTAAAGAIPPTICWDTVGLKWWTCVVSGAAGTAVWSARHNATQSLGFGTAGVTTWVVPAGVTRVKALAVGGGAGGGGCVACTSNGYTAGSGGNGGSQGWGWYTVTPGASITITVGAGGAGGDTQGNPGGNGGTSSFGTFLTAPGGNGGVGNKVVASSGAFVLAPNIIANSPSGSQWGSSESGGHPGIGCSISNVMGGPGGAGLYGGGGSSPSLSLGGGANGSAGSIFGGGGGGASAAGAATSGNTGGAGASGLVLLEW